MTLSTNIDAVRHFNRFYTRQIGVLQGFLASEFSLGEGRVLYEIATREQPTATDVGRELGLDAGYMSRLVRRLEHRGLVRRTRSDADGRRAHLALTRAGQAAFARLNRSTNQDVAARLRILSSSNRRRLVAAMQTIEGVLDTRPHSPVPFVLRPPHAGDLGWVVHRQAAAYAEEWGYNEEYEALVAEIVAGYVRRYDPALERCWIAERDGAVAGSVFLVKKSRTVAKLRLLILAPEARGQGLGARLVGECIAFARQAGYRRLVLWTQSHLAAARAIYQAAGFRKTSSEKHRSFGKKLVAEVWELRL